MRKQDRLQWRDGAEDRLEEILREAVDRSTASDELATRIEDWPTRYHLDRRRTNLLRPLKFEPHLRVLDMGAGTGVMSRYAAEAGATVVAVEGDSRRAQLATIRCEGMDVEVRCATATQIDDAEGFDVVLSIGLLEYFGSQPDEAPNLLRHLAKLVRGGGLLALAIENQLGLAYLLGGNEDHLAQPWVGLEGYPTREAGIRTYSRSKLSALLAQAGLGSQRWFYPFPDYKIPKAILTDDIYLQPDSVDLVDQLVGPALIRDPIGQVAHADFRAVHRELVAAGLGTEVANSFLVLAASDHSSIESLCDTTTMAWHFTGDRRRCYLSERRVSSGEGTLQIDRVRTYPGQELPAGWLTLRKPNPEFERYLSGPTLEQAILARLRAHDILGVSSLLKEFGHWVDSRARPPSTSRSDNPYLRPDSQRVLPGECIDLGFDNLVLDGSDFQLIDDEWLVEGGVDRDLAVLRAIWKLAYVVIASGTRHPWKATSTVDELTQCLYHLFESPAAAAQLEQLYAAEAELMAVVCGGTPSERLNDLRRAGQATAADSTTPPSASNLRRFLRWLNRMPAIRAIVEWVRLRI